MQKWMLFVATSFSIALGVWQFLPLCGGRFVDYSQGVAIGYCGSELRRIAALPGSIDGWASGGHRLYLVRGDFAAARDYRDEGLRSLGNLQLPDSDRIESLELDVSIPLGDAFPLHEAWIANAQTASGLKLLVVMYTSRNYMIIVPGVTDYTADEGLFRVLNSFGVTSGSWVAWRVTTIVVLWVVLLLICSWIGRALARVRQ